MLYAASRSSIITATAQEAGLKIDKKVEAGSPSEITAELVIAEMEPVVATDGDGMERTHDKGFTRPKRPGRR